jgi:hypothetical protein
MLDLYLSELRRFRNSALIYGVATLLLLVLLGQLMELATAEIEVHLGLLLLAMLSGLGLAVAQFVSYRQSSRWIWLLHRPLHRARILGAIMLASMTLIALALALPLFVVLASQMHFTRHVIDVRHVVGAAFLASSALSAWLAGAYIVLHRSRWAFVILVLPILLTMHQAAAGTVLALSVICNVLLAGLVYTVFRPNRFTGDDAVATAGSAIPLQVGFYLALLWGGSTLFQMGLMLVGAHPLSSDHVQPGSYTETARFNPRETLLAGLAGSHDARAPAWRVALAERRNAARVGPTMRQFAVRDMITNARQLRFFDGDEGQWTFSHDRMLYKGLQTRTRASLGWFGSGGPGDLIPFDSQPRTLRDNRGFSYLTNAHDIYQLAEQGRRLRHLLHVNGAEQLGGGIATLGQHTAVLTNRRLAILGSGAGQLSVEADLALPRPFGDLQAVDMAQVADGLLVSFAYGSRQNDGVAGSPQLVYLVAPGGQVQEVAQRELGHDFPLLFEHKDWWLSPALHALVGLPDILIDKGMVPDYGADRFAPLLRARPPAVWAAAIVLALLSGAGAVWWTRRVRMPARARVAWRLACLLLGAPALLSLMVLCPRTRQVKVAAGAGTGARVDAPARQGMPDLAAGG